MTDQSVKIFISCNSPAEKKDVSESGDHGTRLHLHF